MIALTWLRGLLAHRRGRLLADRRSASPSASRCSRRSARSCRRPTSKMTAARDRPASPSTGRSRPQPAPTRPPCCARSARQPGVARRAAGRLRADHRACSASAGGSTQKTGAGQACSACRRLRARRSPGELRTLAGQPAPACCSPSRPPPTCTPRPGDTITIGRAGGGRRARCTVDGVVDLPAADSLFQQRRRAAPAPSRRRRRTTSCCCPQRDVRRASSAARAAVAPQIHARLVARACPAARAPPSRRSPARAQPRDAARRRRPRRRQPRHRPRRARARTRSTPQLLFLFLGVPGASSPACVTALDRRGRRRPAPPRRGAAAHPRRLDRASSCGSRSAETALAGGVGVAVGLGAALVIGTRAFGTASFGAGTLAAVLWAGGAALAGLLDRRRLRSRCPPGATRAR